VCIVFLAIFSVFVIGQDDEDVLVLTSQNFDDTINEHNLILVEFYAPWCGHCKHLAPEYAKVATNLKGIVPLAKVDADEEGNRPLAQRFGIRGFPTLKLFRNGVPTDYQGGRTAVEIESYLRKQALPAVSELETAQAVTDFSTKESVVIVGFFDNSNSADYAKFKEISETFRESFIFGAVINQAKVNKEFEIEATPAVILFKSFDEGKNILSADSFATLEAFIQKHSVPLIDEVGPQNYKTYADSKLPLVYIFVDLSIDGQKEKYVELARPHAVQSKGKINWVYIDWNKYSKHAERLGLTGKTVPALAIENLVEGTHFAFDESSEITDASVSAWISSFLAGNLQPTIKSEDIPASNDGPVTVVVAKNFDEIVNDPTEDVLLEFYAPWCGHCKQLAPIYEEVGTILKDVKNVVIAKIDATANDVSPKLGIKGFPTIKFFPSNNKQAPIDYEGERTVDSFITFVQENSGIKFDFKNLRDEL